MATSPVLTLDCVEFIPETPDFVEAKLRGTPVISEDEPRSGLLDLFSFNFAKALLFGELDPSSDWLGGFLVAAAAGIAASPTPEGAPSLPGLLSLETILARWESLSLRGGGLVARLVAVAGIAASVAGMAASPTPKVGLFLEALEQLVRDLVLDEVEHLSHKVHQITMFLKIEFQMELNSRSIPLVNFAP